MIKSRHGTIPFIAQNLSNLDSFCTREAIAESHKISASYCPKSQTSSPGVSMGTARTYSNTVSGLLHSVDDDRVSDT